jgi:hypothetical protein
MGAIWMKDCEHCLKNGNYQKALDKEKADILAAVEQKMRTGTIDILFEADKILKEHKGE